MRIMKVLPIVILTFATSFAAADKDCSDIDNDRARQECREHNSKDVDCSKLGSDNAREECRERKYGSKREGRLQQAEQRPAAARMPSGKVGLSGPQLSR